MNTLFAVGLTAGLLATPGTAGDQSCLALTGEALNITLGEDHRGFVHHSTLTIVNSCTTNITSRLRVDPEPTNGAAASLRTTFSTSGAELLDANWQNPTVSPHSLEIPAGTTIELNLRTLLTDDATIPAPGNYRADFAVDWLAGAPARTPTTAAPDALGATGRDILPALSLGVAAATAGGLLLILGRSRPQHRPPKPCPPTTNG